MPMIAGSTPSTRYPRRRAIGRTPSRSAAFPPSTTTAAAPSVIPLLLPAVTVPSDLKTGRSFASASTVTPSRGCSSASTVVAPFLPATSIGAISVRNRPSPRALSQRCCVRAA